MPRKPAAASFRSLRSSAFTQTSSSCINTSRANPFVFHFPPPAPTHMTPTQDELLSRPFFCPSQALHSIILTNVRTSGWLSFGGLANETNEQKSKKNKAATIPRTRAMMVTTMLMMMMRRLLPCNRKWKYLPRSCMPHPPIGPGKSGAKFRNFLRECTRRVVQIERKRTVGWGVGKSTGVYAGKG